MPKTVSNIAYLDPKRLLFETSTVEFSCSQLHLVFAFKKINEWPFGLAKTKERGLLDFLHVVENFGKSEAEMKSEKHLLNENV